MVLYPALFSACVVSMFTLCQGRPHPVDSFRNLVRMQVENINARIQLYKDELQIPDIIILHSAELLPEMQSTRSIEGLGSIVDTLNTFQRVLQSLPRGHKDQLHNDISTLQNYLEDRMRLLQCMHRKTAGKKEEEAFLKRHGKHHVTLGYVTLDRLQKYLQRLLTSLDLLKTC